MFAIFGSDWLGTRKSDGVFAVVLTGVPNATVLALTGTLLIKFC